MRYNGIKYEWRFIHWEGRVIGNRRDEAKYNAILAAAINVMAEFGYHHAQVSRIARAAGVADGTVYLYFKNKEDILVSILRSTIGHIVVRCTDEKEAKRSAAEQLMAVVQLYFDFLSERKNLAMVTQVHLRQVDANIRLQIGNIMKPFYNILDQIIEQGISETVFSASTNRRIARRMIFGTMDQTVTAWVLSEGKYNLSVLAKDVVDMLLHGLTGKSTVNM